MKIYQVTKKLQLWFFLKYRDLKGKVRRINSVVSIKINSGRAIENFGWAISAHAVYITAGFSLPA